MRVKYHEVLWELSTATNYECEVPRRIMRVKYRDEFWELTTAVNYESEVPRRIMKVKYREELWYRAVATIYVCQVSRRMTVVGHRAESSNWFMTRKPKMSYRTNTDGELSLWKDYRNNIGSITVKFCSNHWNWNTSPNTEPDLQR
jgi:hypothetical protein